MAPMTVTDGAQGAEIRIYVACLAAYNGGRLHGTWIDAEQDADDIQTQVAAMLASSPEPDAEEWAIHDYEGFEGMTIHESHGFAEVAELAALLSEHGPAYAAYAGHVGEDYATVDGFRDAYAGEWDSEQAYAESYVEDTGMLSEVPEQIQYYFDFEAFGRDIFRDDMYSADSANGIYAFNRN